MKNEELIELITKITVEICNDWHKRMLESCHDMPLTGGSIIPKKLVTGIKESIVIGYDGMPSYMKAMQKHVIYDEYGQMIDDVIKEMKNG